MDNEFEGGQPAGEGSYITSRVGKIYLEDGVGVIEVTLETITAEDIEAHISFMLGMTQETGAIAMPVLLDLGALKEIGWEARVCGGELIRPEWNKKLAFLYHNPVQKMMAGFFAGSNRPQYPWIISSDREASLSWLRAPDDAPDPGEFEAAKPGGRLAEASDALFRIGLRNLVVKPRPSGEMDDIDAILAGIAMLAEDMRSFFEERDRLQEEAVKRRARLVQVVQMRTDEVKEVNESLKREIAIRRQAESELQRINAELENFARTVSNDLKTPLTVIIAGADTLARMIDAPGVDVGELKDMAHLLVKNTRKANQMIDDLMDLADVEGTAVDVTDVDLNEVIGRVLRDRPELTAGGARVEVSNDLGTLLANETHMFELFSNLIANAVEHNTSDSPRVEISLLGRDDSGARIVVCDDGPGIPPDDLDTIFFPFYTGGKGRSGLGLLTVQKVVRLYGGRIRAYNDEGACFEFTLRDYA
ncbi:MAG TPA: HAMP domain-containing sensor histidine kinase [Candidatus Anoxymicrobiaceae bacterium]|jgi:signal transduction histidine kinase